MYRAWNKNFIAALKNKHDELAEYSDAELFKKWRDAFHAEWPSLLTEPESELLRGEELILKSAIQAFEVLFPAVQADPESAAQLVLWLCDQFNQRKKLFTSPLNLELDELVAALEAKLQSQPEPDLQEPGPPGAGRGDSQRLRHIADDASAARRGMEQILSTLANRPRPRAVG
jgi:hypothetical protein